MVVALLLPEVLLIYLDRRMLATMKASMAVEDNDACRRWCRSQCGVD
jgi:hypothetical protein